jgi:proline iminopeptidase
MPTAHVNGVDLYYVIDGEGPPCLIPHGGLGVDNSLYRNSLQPLAKTNQLVFWDHRGNGRSGGEPGTISIPRLADDAVALATELGFDRFNLVGHSYAGFVSQELALSNPLRVARLILTNTTPGQLGTREDPDAYAGDPPPGELNDLLSNMPATDDDYAAMFEIMAPYYFHDPANVPSHDEVIFRVEAMLQGFVALSMWSAVDRLHVITCPTLLIGGRHDIFTGWRQMHRIGDRISGSSVTVFEHSGHFPWIEEPDAWFRLVGAFLAGES